MGILGGSVLMLIAAMIGAVALGELYLHGTRLRTEPPMLGAYTLSLIFGAILGSWLTLLTYTAKNLI